MRIKKLHIRNIASIERADIDFENDLISESESSPASLFLISGDTGAGKTVILDCISMALFGTTPRVRSVSNRSNNTFFGSDGNEIKIYDVSQYTRLGISSKDDCYSRLVFEGNDGLVYDATLFLGVARTGKYRASAWRLAISNGEVLEGNKKDEIKQRIVDAVGLNYDQFCRMAMLAQGQFANFLTGGKEEREKILEQLTSTGHFSRYGEAIERIFKRAKTDKEDCEKLIAAESKHILTPEQETETREELKRLNESAEGIKRKKDAVAELIELTAKLADTNKTIRDTTVEIDGLNVVISSDEFKEKKQLVALWDATSQERDLLKKKTEANMQIRTCREKFGYVEKQFNLLSQCSDTLSNSLNEEKGEVASMQATLNDSVAFDDLFRNATAIAEKLKNRGGHIADKKRDLAELKVKQQERTGLEENLKKATEEASEAAGRLKEMRDSITVLYNEKEALNPKATSQKLSDAEKEKKELEGIIDLIGKVDELRAEFDEMEKARKEAQEKYSEIKALAEKATRVATKNSEALQTAKDRYATMHLSVEENFNTLRLRLAAEHASKCPLCGSDHDWALNHDAELLNFKDILSPLAKEVDALTEECKKSDAERDEKIKEEHQTAGKLKAQEKNCTSQKEKTDKAASELKKVIRPVASLSEIGVTDTDRLKESAEASLRSVETEIEKISSTIEKINGLQGKIDDLVKKTQPIATEASNREKKRNAAETALKLNTEQTSNLSNNLGSIDRKIHDLEVELAKVLPPYSADWKNDGELINRLKKDSNDYLSLRDKVDKKQGAIKNSEEELKRVRQTEGNVKRIIEDFKSSFSRLNADKDFGNFIPQETASEEGDLNQAKENLSADWTSLYGEALSLHNSFEQAARAYNESASSLREYFEESGNNEETLSALLDKSLAIPALRKYVGEEENRLSSLTDALEKAKKEGEMVLNTLLDKCAIDEAASLPELAALVQEKAEKEKLHEETLQLIGRATDRLQVNAGNKERIEELRKELELKVARFSEWDRLNRHFGGSRFRTLVQSYILRPLLRNANVYLRRITDHFTLTCSEQNEQLSILVLDRYNKNQVRSATVLSGGERFMISLALSLALSSMNKAGMNVDILFIDEGFGTLDARSLNAVMDTLRRLPEIAGQNGRRVGVISHREELAERIDVQIQVKKCGEGRSRVEIVSN